jgi:glutamyl-tRNA synthetase
MENYNLDVTEEEWFENMKQIAESMKFTSDRKAYKDNPDEYYGQVGDAAGFIRLAIAGRKSTPNIYYVQKILGYDEVLRRVNVTIDILSK